GKTVLLRWCITGVATGNHVEGLGVRGDARGVGARGGLREVSPVLGRTIFVDADVERFRLVTVLTNLDAMRACIQPESAILKIGHGPAVEAVDEHLCRRRRYEQRDSALREIRWLLGRWRVRAVTTGIVVRAISAGIST